MAKPAWMKFEPSAFLVGTQAFSAAERGIYITLICYQWEKGGRLPADHEKLARLCGVSLDEFDTAWETVSEKFDHDGAGYFNPRGLATLEDAVSLMEKRSEAGKRGAAALHYGKRMANAEQTHADAMTRASDSLSSCNEPTTPPTTSPSPPVVLPSPAPDLPEALRTDAFRQAWNEWITYRRSRRWTTRTDWQAKQLALLASHGPVVAARALEASMMQGWQGVFPEKVAPAATGLTPPPEDLESIRADARWRVAQKDALTPGDMARFDAEVKLATSVSAVRAVLARADAAELAALKEATG